MSNPWGWTVIIFLVLILTLLVWGNEAKHHREIDEYEARWDRSGDNDRSY